MKKIICIIALFYLAGCSSRIVRPEPPPELKSSYRKTVEVLLVNCQAPEKSYVRSNQKEQISVVETTDTGQRFEVYGCYGKPGDRFRIAY